MYDLSTIFNGLNLSKSDLASFLGMTRGALYTATKTQIGIPKQHLDTLLALDIHLVLCEQDNVVMDEIRVIEKTNAEVLANSLRTQKEYCEAQIEKLSTKLAEMQSNYEKEKKALNNFLYISERDKLLGEQYHAWIRTHINVLRDELGKNAPDQQELLAVKIEAFQMEVVILNKRIPA